MMPVILISISVGPSTPNDLRYGTIESRKIAFISDGTPGNEKIVVLPDLILTAGAVPTDFVTASAPCGKIAIFVLYFVSVGVESSL